MRALQTTFPEHPGLLVVVDTYGSGGIDQRRGNWYVKIWDWNTPHHQTADEFHSRDAAKAWAEREFLIDPAAWEPCDAIGSRETIVEVLKRIYPRRLACAEAAAVARLAYAYEFIDARGRPIWPGEERCITSYNVIADVMDALDWDRETCPLFPTDACNSYGFVADADHWADAVEASPEFRGMWDAFVDAAGVTEWGSSQVRPVPRAVDLPGAGLLSSAIQALLGDARHTGYETGAMSNAFGITQGAHILPIDAGRSISLDERWTDVRTMDVASRDDGLHVLLHRRLPDGSCRSYLTSVDGTLRSALLRGDERQPCVALSAGGERERFESEVEAWIAASTSAAGGAETSHFAVSAGEIDRLVARLAANDGALGEALAFLRARHVFVAEEMNGAPPHVVRRVVLGALEQLKPG